MKENRVEEIEGRNFFHIISFQSHVLSSIKNSFAVILYYQQVDTLNMLNFIRSNANPAISQVPVVVYTSKSDVGVKIEYLSDSVVSNLDSLSDTIAEFELINEARYRYVIAPIKSQTVVRNVMQFIHSRSKFNNSISPIISSDSVTGYFYPIVWAQFSANHTKNAIGLFEDALENEYLIPHFHDVVHLCPNCLSSFVNIREVCVSCGSTNLTEEPTIHHFVCANISPESEYMLADGRMVCPQCNRLLKNMGVDYDKPSMLYKCNSCTYQFQQPDMDTLCFNCGAVYSVDKLKRYNVYDYELTHKGIQSLTESIGVGDEENIPLCKGYIRLSEYKVILQLDMKRRKQFNETLLISLVNFKIDSPNKIELLKEVCELLITNTPEYVTLANKQGVFAFIYPSDFVFDDIFALFKYNVDQAVELLTQRLENDEKAIVQKSTVEKSKRSKLKKTDNKITNQFTYKAKVIEYYNNSRRVEDI